MPLSSHHRNARPPFPAPYSPGEVIRIKRSFQGVMYALRAQGREADTAAWRDTPRGRDFISSAQPGPHERGEGAECLQHPSTNHESDNSGSSISPDIVLAKLHRLMHG